VDEDGKSALLVVGTLIIAGAKDAPGRNDGTLVIAFAVGTLVVLLGVCAVVGTRIVGFLTVAGAVVVCAPEGAVLFGDTEGARTELEGCTTALDVGVEVTPLAGPVEADG
jgi:hypothetical protein